MRLDVFKYKSATFYSSEEAFGSIPILTATHLKSERKPGQRNFEMMSVINHGLLSNHQYPVEVQKSTVSCAVMFERG